MISLFSGIAGKGYILMMRSLITFRVSELLYVWKVVEQWGCERPPSFSFPVFSRGAQPGNVISAQATASYGTLIVFAGAQTLTQSARVGWRLALGVMVS